jgi:hypothetical protein
MTAICVLSGVGIVFTIPLIFSEAATSIGAWYPPFLAASAAVGAACTVGFWLMRRWAVYLYAGFLCLTQIVLLAMGAWNIVALLIPLAVVIIGLFQPARAASVSGFYADGRGSPAWVRVRHSSCVNQKAMLF